MDSRRYATETLPLPEATFVLLRDLLVERIGVIFDEQKRELLADKLSELVMARGLTSFLDYYYLLRYDDLAAPTEWARVGDRLAVPETFFWRQREHFDTLARIIAPRHFTEHPGRRLRIWSAACCSGEEPVSIAMALAEAGLLDERVEIVGSDLSGAMLERARRASYGERAFRQLPPHLRSKYFVRNAEGLESPTPAITKYIRYEQANLTDPAAIAHLATSDVIFCRNVFIYFSDDAIRGVVRTFLRLMPADGFVLLGAAESLARLGVDLEPADLSGSFVYVRPDMRRVVERSSSVAGRTTTGGRMTADITAGRSDR